MTMNPDSYSDKLSGLVSFTQWMPFIPTRIPTLCRDRRGSIRANG